MKVRATQAIMECLLEQEVDTVFGYPLTRVEILNREGEAALGKPKGTYLTLELPQLPREREEVLRAARGVAAVLEALPFGGGCVNDTVVHLADPRLPFGGVGNSGMGACHGKAGFDAFTHEKSVLKKGRLDIPVRYPPYGKKHLGILKKLM